MTTNIHRSLPTASSYPKMSKCAQLRQMLESPQMEFLMEAHNGISARIVEEAGFKGIWASGLALSAQYGVRDNNEASWTQILDMLEFMSDVTQIPILLDGDTGYGNFNNMRRLVRKLEQRGIAGVCIEDKLFPKTNSFISNCQPLINIDEFCGKIKAGKDSQSNQEFCLVARIEAFIAGWDLAEAIRRAEAYAAAGADAILIHSKLSRPDQIIAFAKEWDDRLPLVIIPTKYYSTPTAVFRRSKIRLVIWANHMIRAAIVSMQAMAREVQRSETVSGIEDSIAPMQEIFRLQGADELLEAEKRYLTSPQNQNRAIILAASRGKELGELTQNQPKVMLPIGGKSLLQRLVDQLKQQGINDINLVAGYKAEKIDVKSIQVILNPEYDTTGELVSLVCAQSRFSDNMLIIYGDLLFRNYILKDLLDCPGEIVVVVDSAPTIAPISGSPDYAYCSHQDDRSLFGLDVRLLCISDAIQPDFGHVCGRWIGMLLLRSKGREWLLAALDELKQKNNFNMMRISHLCNYLVEHGIPIKVFYIYGHWLDINSLDDFSRAQNTYT